MCLRFRMCLLVWKKNESIENKIIFSTSFVHLSKKRIRSYFQWNDIDSMWYPYFFFFYFLHFLLEELLNLKQLDKILFFIQFQIQNETNIILLV